MTVRTVGSSLGLHTSTCIPGVSSIITSTSRVSPLCETGGISDPSIGTGMGGNHFGSPVFATCNQIFCTNAFVASRDDGILGKVFSQGSYNIKLF